MTQPENTSALAMQEFGNMAALLGAAFLQNEVFVVDADGQYRREQITPNEMELVPHCVAGIDRDEIAVSVLSSVSMVAMHRRSLFTKIGVRLERGKEHAPRRLIEVGLAGPPNVSGVKPALTGRELEVLDLSSRGQTVSEMAGTMGVSFATAKTHVTRMMDKLGCGNRAKAAATGFGWGFLQPDYDILHPDVVENMAEARLLMAQAWQLVMGVAVPGGVPDVLGAMLYQSNNGRKSP